MDVVLLGSLVAIVAGLAILWFAGGKVVEYALRTSQAFEVTTFFVGFVILAMAADLPELAVAITSALRGVSEIAVGDLVGANFCDVSLVTGVAAVVAGTIKIGLQERRRLLFLLSCTTVVMLIVFSIGTLLPKHGVVLISIYLLSIFTVWKNRKKSSNSEYGLETIYQADNPDEDKESKWWLLTKLLMCLFATLGCSSMIVYFAELFAISCGIQLEAVGATIVAVGTSLPELSLSLNALKRKEYALALGPTLGTVLEQCTLILGILTVLSDKPINLVPVYGASIFMFIGFIIVGCSLLCEKIERRVGVALLSLFVCYIAYHFV